MDKSDNDMVAPNNPRLAGARGDPCLYRPSDWENSNFKVFQERIQISRKDSNSKKGFKFQERIQISRYSKIGWKQVSPSSPKVIGD